MKVLVSGIRKLIADHPKTDKDTIQVRFNNFAESSLDILVQFFLQVEDYSTELGEREAVLLQIMEFVKAAGAEFAFPTQTLHVDTSLQRMRGRRHGLHRARTSLTLAGDRII